jgi:HD superfamily phosphohydrolase
MRMSARQYEIRDPVHGFIGLNEWEWDIINHPVFQRLRRIRQLGFTDMVYPGAMHTRFEHSLGVMHVATRMFDRIVEKRSEFLKKELNYDDVGLKRERVLVRLSGLLHDIGHAPFSHASEGLMDNDPSGKPYKHEHYSAAAVSFLMKDMIENHPINRNYEIKVQHIEDFLNGESRLGRSLLWRSLVSGDNMDADRADYLRRDSHHIGVAYGHYDLDRLVSTLTVAIDPEKGAPVLAVEDGGLHAAEALIIARYMMFTQVYFHHTRRAYDHHSSEAIRHLLSVHQKGSCLPNKSAFPPPTSVHNMEEYLEWDDWRVLGLIHDNQAGEHGQILKQRDHYRVVYETTEMPKAEELVFAEEVKNDLGTAVGFIDKASKSWYKPDADDIPLLWHPEQSDEQLDRLSTRSAVINGSTVINGSAVPNGLQNVAKTRIYVPAKEKTKAKHRVDALRKRSMSRE